MEAKEIIKNEIINDIYDIIFNTRFKKNAIKRFKPRWFKKNVSVNYTEGKEKYIEIGKKYRLILR
jgi:hypothetical protein